MNPTGPGGFQQPGWQRRFKAPMQFAGLPPRPRRTQAEIELDQRLEATARALAGPAVSKVEWARAQYRAASRGGMSKAQIEARYNYSDVRAMDEHVEQIFWQMVRHQLRTNQNFVRQLEFISNFYEVPQHEFLERIKKRHWAQMQVWTDDRQHLGFLTEVLRAFRAAKDQIADVDPANDLRRQRERDAEQFAQRSWAARLETSWNDPTDQEMVQWLEELGQ